jgi:site-specific recombinase XerD
MQFLTFKRADGRAPRTLKDYQEHISFFYRSYPDAWEQPRPAVMAYLSRYENPSTYNLRLAYLKVWFDWLMAEGLFPGDRHPLMGLKKRKPQGRVVDIPAATLKALLDAPDTSTYAGLRDRALMLLQIDTGVRPGEALSLMETDLDMASMVVHVPAHVSKTRERRSMPFSATTADALQRLLRVRPEEWKESPVFCSCSGEHMYPSSWNHRIKGYGEKIGAEITPYMLRHCFALSFLRNGGNVFSLQKLLGHSTLAMTQKYLALSMEDLQKAHAAASPVNALIPKKKKMGKVQL